MSKTYGLIVPIRGQDRWVTVSAPSKAAAIRALAEVGVTRYYFDRYGSETWNEKDIEATRSPGVVFIDGEATP